MAHEALWKIGMSLQEHQRQTRATAVLRGPAGEHRAVGLAWRDPDDEPVPAIGRSLAGGRALLELAQQLFEDARRAGAAPAATAVPDVSRVPAG
ncbi:MAG TPA: dsRBD fold-containing protein [Jatrophihabitans sp.]|nr:dsRBD fold-containing protein [Jatrophihabitans sp.]